MVKIYTKNGDNGTTSLLGKGKYPKYDLAFDVIGTLDELNSILGFTHTIRSKKIKEKVLEIQKDIFTIGTHVAGKKFLVADVKVWENKLKEIEKFIDEIDKRNKPLKKFIIPGGKLEATYMHLARTVSRRAERLFVKYVNRHRKKKMLIIQKYLNRISDLFFVLARQINKLNDINEIVWEAA